MAANELAMNVRLVFFQAVLVCASILSNVAHANPEIVIGNTIAIVEPDVLVEIQSRASQVDWESAFDSDPETWSGFSSDKLPSAEQDVVRLHQPLYTLDQDITDQHGQVIYPKGFTFNPMSYVKLPSNIIVIGDKPEYDEWLTEHAGAFDMVLTAGGDPMKLGERYGRPIFILEPRMRERLGVNVVPSIITQKGDSLQIKEMVLESENKRTNAQQRVQDES